MSAPSASSADTNVVATASAARHDASTAARSSATACARSASATSANTHTAAQHPHRARLAKLPGSQSSRGQIR
ncbi:hypothetical protein KJY78_03825 [Canibacter sp. lx-45]|uniref:hypothetical protein n=1 Tax=Canibacter zhuwentaonis TaxID=2837491 RepID=UPI001BDC928D|nr:hypothetical protein [Canibacter zhuwentaonis]MBT1035480.1 hypothetical protein [Canibacter zhuwentaonis]